MVYKRTKKGKFIKCEGNCQKCKEKGCITINCDGVCNNCRYDINCPLKTPSTTPIKKSEEKVEDLSQIIDDLKNEIIIHQQLKKEISSGIWRKKENKDGKLIKEPSDIINLYPLYYVEEELLETENELYEYLNQIQKEKVE